MAISNLFNLIKDPLKAAYDKYGPQYKEDLSTIGQFAKESAQPAVDFVANAPIVKSASAFLDNPTPQELGQQVANIGGAFSESAQQFVDDFQQMPLIGGMTAYHGTPHKIVGGFKKSAIGSGEGAQAFGHGFYATEAKEIGEDYARKLSGGNLFYKGEGYIEPPFTQEIKDVLSVVNRQKAKTLQEAFDLAEIELKQNKWSGKLYKKALNKIRETEGFEWKPSGRVYTLDIPEPDVMLDWDKPVSKQVISGGNPLKMVIKKNPEPISRDESWIIELEDGTSLDAYGTKKEAQEFIDNIPGGELYKRLFTKKGATASDYLHSKGIKGINYPAGSISGAKTTARNYVIFEPEDIKILAEEFLDK